MAIVTPSSLLQLGSSVPAQFERLRTSHLTRSWPSSATNGNTRLDGQGGIWPQSNALNITASGTPDMNIHVDRGSGITPGTENVAQGNYPFFNDASLTVGIAASNTQQRIDSIVGHVKDAFYSGASNLFECIAIAGTPGSGSPPNLSILDKNYIEIGRVTVRANTTSILNTDIQNMQHFLPVGLDIPQSFELSNVGSFVGHPRVNTSSGEFEWWDGSQWRAQQWVAYTPNWILGTGTVGTGFTQGARYFKQGKKVSMRAWLTGGSGAAFVSGAVTVSLPFNSSSSASDFNVGPCVHRDPSGVATDIRMRVAVSASTGAIFGLNASKQYVNPDAVLTFTSGSQLFVQCEYESV